MKGLEPQIFLFGAQPMPLLERIYDLERARQVSVIPFFYTAQFLAGIGVSTSLSVNTNIQSDSDFVCRYLTCTVYTPSTTVLAGLAQLRVSLFDTGSGRTLMDNATAIQNIIGGPMGTVGGTGGSAPFIFPEPWLLRAGGTVQTTLTNLSATLAFGVIDFAFSGMKVFKFGSSSPAGGLL